MSDQKSENEPIQAEIVKSDEEGGALEKEASPLDALSEKEKYAYNYFLERRGRIGAGSSYSPLAPSLAGKLFGLYLEGMTLTEIQESNPSYSLGQIVYAAVENDWPAKKTEHVAGVMARVSEQVYKTQSESILFVSQLLSSNMKVHGEALRKYLMSGDAKDLGPLTVTSVKQLRDLVDLFSKVTGQEDNKKVSGTVHHEHHLQIPISPIAPASPASDANLLAQLAGEEKTRKK